MFCNKCGDKIAEDAIFCQKCGAKIENGDGTEKNLDTRARIPEKAAAVTQSKQPDRRSINSEPMQSETAITMEKYYSKVIELFFEVKEFYSECFGEDAMWAAVASLIGILILVFLFTFSFPLFIIIAAGGYVLYHMWGAKHITEYKYAKESKVLNLPEGMSSNGLFEALNGKLNYPYFKGVRYGDAGECIIEGRYSVYPVVFDENGEATLTCDFNVEDKKKRATMLEAISIRQYVNKFFNSTLPFDAVKSYNSLRSAEKQRKISAAVLVATIIIVVSIKSGAPGGIEYLMTPGSEVRMAYLTEYSDAVTIEKAFHNFFGNPKWSTYKESGDSYVVFTGRASGDEGKKVYVKITFKVAGEKFGIDRLEVDGQTMPPFHMHVLLSKVYEEYLD